MKGNEKDCICEKPNGKYRKYCNASYKLSEFLKKAGFPNLVKLLKENERTKKPNTD